jgi:hypothetical protein
MLSVPPLLVPLFWLDCIELRYFIPGISERPLFDAACHRLEKSNPSHSTLDVHRHVDTSCFDHIYASW